MISRKSSFGDLYEYTVMLGGEEVTNYVLDMKIYQDMLSPFVTGTIDMFDAENRVETVKLAMPVKIKMKTKQGYDTDGEIDITLEVYNISKRKSDKDRSQYFTIFIANSAFRRDTETLVSQGFTDKKPKQIIDELLGKVGIGIDKVVESEPTNKMSYIAPNVAPLIAVNTILRFTKPDTDFFIFPYEVSGGIKYQMGSLEKMMKKDAVAEFDQRMYNHNEARGNQNLQIRTFHINQLDEMTNKMVGYSASTVATMNTSDKKFKQKGNTFVGSSSPQANITFQPVAKEQFDKGISMPESADEWVAARKNSFFKLIQFPVYFSTFGFCKAGEWLGKTIKLGIPEHKYDKRNMETSPYFKGEKFLICAVTHHINSKLQYRNSFKVVNWNMVHNY